MKIENAQFIMSLDQGTTSSRCILFDKAGNLVSMVQREFEQNYPQPGWVEHDPMEIWSSQIGTAIEAMAKIGAKPENIAGIGITNQRETTIVWDKETGEPVYNAIVWQCRRTANQIEELRGSEIYKKIPGKTGLIPDAYFSATKI
ncbi:MAG: glycerol kinase, partial [Clostridium sp.]|nr:glycerol kinase [Clostridium sp.]